MSPLLKKTLNAGILTLILAIAGLITSNLYPALIDRQSLTIMLISMFLITSIVFTIVFAGETRPADVQTMFSFAALGAKFILSAILALLYFNGFKKYGMSNILLFFILYLAFTIYMIVVIVKILNIRSLKATKIEN